MTIKNKIRRFLNKGLSATEIAKKLNVTPAHVHTTKYEIKKESESRREVMKRTMQKKPSKIIAAVKEMKTALDALEKERADEARSTKLNKKPTKLFVQPKHLKTALELLDKEKADKEYEFGPNVTTRRFTKEEIKALDSTPDFVNHPPHYKTGGIETIDFIEAKDLNYRLGNVIKYVSRAGKKGDPLEDLRKAKWYLEREIAARERA